MNGHGPESHNKNLGQRGTLMKKPRGCLKERMSSPLRNPNFSVSDSLWEKKV